MDVFWLLTTLSPVAIALMQWSEQLALRDQVPGQMRRVPRRDARALVGGELVRVCGRVDAEADRLVQAPLSGRPCVAYSVRVSHLAGKQGRRLLAEDADSAPFWLRDDTGRVLVEADGERPSLVMKRLSASGTLSPRVFREFLQRHGAGPGLVDLRFEEGVLAVGARVAVVGRVRLDATRAGEDGARDYRQDAGGLVIEEPDASGVQISNQPATLR